MPADLTSANRKIDRALELLHGLDIEVQAWGNNNPYGFFITENPEHTRYAVVVKEFHAPDAVRWSLIFADIVHNLRCALDHAFWAVLDDFYGGDIPDKASKLTFPIWDSAPNSDQLKPFKHIDPKIVAAIEAVQPYHHPPAKFPLHPLTIIRDIDNGNKHKLLFSVIPSVARVYAKAAGIRQHSYESVQNELYRGELHDGVEALVTTFPVPHPNAQYECTEFMAIIAIRHPVANRLGEDRDDYAALIDAFVAEVRITINDVVARVE